MCWAWRCRMEIRRVPNDPLRLFSRLGRPPIGLEIEILEAVAGGPEGRFFSLKMLFRFSIRTPARIVDFIDVLHDFGSARGARCVHIAMCIETRVIIGCVRACGQILGIPWR